MPEEVHDVPEPKVAANFKLDLTRDTNFGGGSEISAHEIVASRLAGRASVATELTTPIQFDD